MKSRFCPGSLTRLKFSTALAQAVCLLLFLFVISGHGAESVRPASWATPLIQKGLPNFFRVSPTLYRGAQPTKEGFVELKQLGIKTIVNLRTSNYDEEMTSGLGFTYYHLSTTASRPDKEIYKKFLSIARDPDLQPVFVHCRHGADRTGTAVALYRIMVQNWEKHEAIREMKDGGYGFHSVFQGLIKFIADFDEENNVAGTIGGR